MARKKRNPGAGPNFSNVNDINKFLGKVVKDIISGQPNMASIPGAQNIQSFTFKIDYVSHQGPGNTLNHQQPQAEAMLEPLFDIVEAPDSYTVIGEMPGLKREEIEVTVHGRSLRISSTSQKRECNKSITLSADVTPIGATARYNSGILELRLRKGAAQAAASRIFVK